MPMVYSHRRFLLYLWLLSQLVTRLSSGFTLLQLAPVKQDMYVTERLPTFNVAISVAKSALLASRGSAMLDDKNEKIVDHVSRRSMLSFLSAAGVVAAMSTEFDGTIIHPPGNVNDGASIIPQTVDAHVDGSRGSTGTIRQLQSLDEALEVIATSCDRRFLEAIVSSDYRLMYRGVDEEKEGGPIIAIRCEASDLLDPSTYDSIEAAKYFLTLEEGLKNRKSPVRPSNGHLAVTSIEDARSWGGSAVSVWPLVTPRGVNPTASPSQSSRSNVDAVHFAWLEKGGVFWPNESINNKTESVLVDGIDCGRQALDDALKGDGWEIMFNSGSFLSVPASMDRELIAKLKRAYLI